MPDVSRVHPTVYPPALWRRVAAAQAKTNAEFVAEVVAYSEHDNAADTAIRAELAQLGAGLYDLLFERVQRLHALGRLLPQAQNAAEALSLADLVWTDTGLPQSFPLAGPWLP
jgi:hypothetical protein